MSTAVRRYSGTVVRRAGALTVVLSLTIPPALAAQFPTEPPTAMELKELQFPPFQEATLSNGLQLLVVENHRLPIVSVRLSMHAGSRNDPDGLEGLADMVAALLTKGTERRTAEQIAEEIEGVGASLTAGAGNDFFSVFTTVLTEHAELAFDLLSDVLLHSTFPESELELERTRTLSELQIEKSRPAALATRHFSRLVYGEHPYGRRESEATVEAITRDAIQSYASTYLRPGGALLVLAGDISLNDARRMVDRFLGSWSGTPPVAKYAAPAAPQGTEILLVHRPGSAQSNIRVGNLALRPGDDLYYPTVVANKILGDGTDARLFMILREQKSWTYGAYSDVARRKDVGYFQANTEVRTEVTDSALVELLYQLKRIRSEAVSEEELTAAKGYLVGSFPLSIQTPQQIANQAARVKLLGLGEDYLRQYRQRLAAVTTDQAMYAAERVIRPDSAVIIVVGDGQAVYDELAAIAPVKIIDVEGDPLEPADLTPVAMAVEFDPAQITARRDSFQVTFQGNPMGTRVIEIAEEAGTLVVTESFAIPMAGVQTQSTITIDATSLAVLSHEASGQIQGQASEVKMTYGEGGTVMGSAKAPQPSGTPKEITVDTMLAEGTLDSEAFEVLLPALALEEGASFTVNTFDASEGNVEVATVKVAAVEDLTVPAGTFAVFRINFTAGEQAMTLYVTRDAPRRLVKLQLVQPPISVELVK